MLLSRPDSCRSTRAGVGTLACGPQPAATGVCKRSFAGARGARSLVPRPSLASFAPYLERRAEPSLQSPRRLPSGTSQSKVASPCPGRSLCFPMPDARLSLEVWG